MILLMIRFENIAVIIITILHSISFMPAIAGTSGRLHSEFVRLLFLQAHRETDRFFAASGVQLAQTNSGLFGSGIRKWNCLLAVDVR
jgi:hypothetical protein